MIRVRIRALVQRSLGADDPIWCCSEDRHLGVSDGASYKVPGIEKVYRTSTLA